MAFYMSTTAQVYALTRLGLPCRTAAERTSSWKTYQAAATWGKPLEVDGKPGPATQASVKIAKAYGYRVSKHYHLKEFRCGCGGRYHHKYKNAVKRSLIVSLEKARAKVYHGAPMPIVSGWRCRQHNAALGGLDIGGRVSAHVQGLAADVPRYAEPKAFFYLGFNGIGYRDHGLVTHVDQAPWLAPNTPFKE